MLDLFAGTALAGPARATPPSSAALCPRATHSPSCQGHPARSGTPSRTPGSPRRSLMLLRRRDCLPHVLAALARTETSVPASTQRHDVRAKLGSALGCRPSRTCIDHVVDRCRDPNRVAAAHPIARINETARKRLYSSSCCDVWRRPPLRPQPTSTLVANLNTLVPNDRDTLMGLE